MSRDTLRTRIRRSIMFTAAIAGLAWGTDARAADEMSETLLREAKLQMEQKRYKDACPKLEQSHLRAPSGEKIFELGRCHKEEGRFATAYYELREAIDIARRDGRWDRVRMATGMLEEIEPKIPKIEVTVSLHASSLPGFQVKRDGIPLRTSEWTTAFPVDPGVHTIMATAPGYKSMLKTLELAADGTIAKVEIDDLATDAPRPRTSAAPIPAREESTSSLGAQQMAALVVGGVGIVGLGVGTGLGVRAAAVQRDSEAHCTGGACDAEGKRMRNSAESLGTTATLSLIGGGVLTAGGVLLFFTAPSHTTTGRAPGVTTVSLGPTGGFVSGQW